MRIDFAKRCAAALQIDSDRANPPEMAGLDILGRVKLCADYGFLIPNWLRMEYGRRFDAVWFADVGSWDDPAAFGPPNPKGTRIEALRLRRRLRHPVYVRLFELRRAGAPMDEHTLETVGKEFGIGKTLAADMYYSVEQDLRQFRVAAARLRKSQAIAGGTSTKLPPKLRNSRKYKPPR
jgi:hypothetical protein